MPKIFKIECDGCGKDITLNTFYKISTEGRKPLSWPNYENKYFCHKKCILKHFYPILSEHYKIKYDNKGNGKM